jgi:hypothetical protein
MGSMTAAAAERSSTTAMAKRREGLSVTHGGGSTARSRGQEKTMGENRQVVA